MKTTLYVIKEKANKKKIRTGARKRRRSSQAEEHSCSGRESWVLASSLGGKGYLFARRIKKIYKQRMQIEEAFRDLKSSTYGFSFEKAFSKSTLRIENLLLIAMLASLVAWLTGWIGERRKIQYQFQSNSIKGRRVLSLFFLGCQMLRKKIEIDIKELLSFASKGFPYLK